MFQERWQKLIAMDKIRLGKFIEMFQYTFLFFVMAIFTSMLLNKYIYENRKEIIDKMNTSQLFLNIFHEMFVFVIVLFYIRKIVLLFPSIVVLFIQGFQPHTTLEYTVEFPFIYLFLELIVQLRYKIERLKSFLLGE